MSDLKNWETAADGKKYRTRHYNLDLILAIDKLKRNKKGIDND